MTAIYIKSILQERLIQQQNQNMSLLEQINFKRIIIIEKIKSETQDDELIDRIPEMDTNELKYILKEYFSK